MKAVGVKAASSTVEGSGHGRHSYGDNVPPKERRSDKQRGHSRQHAGFNDRWDAMERAEQQSRPAMMRNVWFVSPSGYDEAHFAVMPDEIARRCILAGCPEGGHVLDPFGGAGTTGLVARQLKRDATLIELNPEYAKLAQTRIDAAFMGKESGARHMAKQLGKDRVPFEAGSLFAGIEVAAE
jgi:DNA modification methylase